MAPQPMAQKKMMRPSQSPMRPEGSPAAVNGGTPPAPPGAPGAMGEPPNPTGGVGVGQPGAAPAPPPGPPPQPPPPMPPPIATARPGVGGAGPRTETGDLFGRPAMPGGRPGPANANGFRSFVPATGVAEPSRRPETGQVAPPPPAPIAEPPNPTGMVPPTPQPPAPIVEPPSPTGGVGVGDANPAPMGLFPGEVGVEPEFRRARRGDRPNLQLPGKDTQPIDPANDLRNKQITSAGDPRRAQYAADVDRLFRSLPQDLTSGSKKIADDTLAEYGDLNLEGGDAISPVASARLKARQGMTDDALTGIAAVDRFKLAQDKFNQFAEETAPEYEFANRVATSRNAAKGRMGSGMLRTDYGNLDLARARDLDLQKKKVFTEALEGSIGDSFKKADVLQGAERDLTDQELSEREEARGERGYSDSFREGNLNRRIEAKSASLNRGDRMAGENIANLFRQVGLGRDLETGARDDAGRDASELRGERDYQNEMERQAFTRRRQQVFDQDSLTDSAFNRDVRRLAAGEAGNPGGAEIDVAGNRREDANAQMEAIARLFGQIGQNSTNPTAPGQPSPGWLEQLMGIFGGGKKPAASARPEYGRQE
jgi:hypothetical protein